MKTGISCVLTVGILLAVVYAASSEKQSGVEVAVLSEANWDQFAPEGKEVDAIYGDVVLRNEHLTAVIAAPRQDRHANMTVRDVGGALIDLTTRDGQSDQLSAFYPGRRKHPLRSWTINVDGHKAAVTEDGNVARGRESVAVVVTGPAQNGFEVQVTYSLKPDSRKLDIVTRYENKGDKPVAVALEDDIRADGGKEDMAKAPNGTDPLFWIHDQYWDQAYGVLSTPSCSIQSNSNARESVLKYQSTSGQSEVTIPPGKDYQLTRSIFPGRDLLEVRAVAGELRGDVSYPVKLALEDGNGRPVPQARVQVFREGTSLGTANGNERGMVETRLPAGGYGVEVTAIGVRVTGDKLLTISVEAVEKPQSFPVKLAGYKPGTVSAKITDERGRPIPCKVEFFAQGDTPRVDFGPETAEFAVKNLRYTPNGKFEQQLPAGRYKVTISRGPEYDVLFTELTVPPGKTVPLTGKLVRSVKTPGWVSSDFHSHSSPSGDNTGSQFGRVLNLICEHIEFAPCTEHNRVSTYDEHIKRLGAGSEVATISGIELTGRPLPLNHQNAFPMKYKPHTQDGGGPLTDVDPEQQIERLALWDDRSEKLVQQNHPDLGWLFYDRNGDGKPDGGYERTFAFMDVMEIHPIENAHLLAPEILQGDRKWHNNVFNWLQLLNQGFRIYGVVNTDAHYNYHGSGGLRNWIQSSTDDPAQIDPMEMVKASESGRLIMSNGPFLEVWAQAAGNKERVTAGQDLAAESGKVNLHVRVQCANWFDIDRVKVLVNGRVHKVHDYSREMHANRFRSGTVKFDDRLELELDADAHVVVVTGSDEKRLGPVMGPFWGSRRPTAISNPIFVDVDGGGFQSNKDTLEHPLPVKYGAGKL